MTTKDFTPAQQKLIAAMIADAVSEERAKKDINKGAVWASKPEAKTDLSGHINVDGVEYVLCMYATGASIGDTGKNGGALPLYNVSVFIPKDE